MVGAAALVSLPSQLHAAPKPSVWAVDGVGTVRPLSATSASLQRTPPAAAPADLSQPHGDPDALRLIVAGTAEQLPSRVSIESLDKAGGTVGQLRDVGLQSLPCPGPITAPHCAATPPIRAVIDLVDASHPLVRERSVVARLGGSLVVRTSAGQEVGRTTVSGPRRSPIGAIAHHRAKMRVMVVRMTPGGPLPLGGDAQAAEQAARRAVARANGLWGSCGIGFGDPKDLVVRIVDPPPSHLLSLGCGHGLPASGGFIRLRVAGQALRVEIAPGMLPREAARRVAMALERAGFRAIVSDNPAAAGSEIGSADISVRTRRGRLVVLEPPSSRAVSDDATLTACIGQVNLEDGLQHFTNSNSMVGTLEERALLKAYDDGDPSTLDVFWVHGFAGGGRIGESFIGADDGSLRNTVIVDRAGILTNRASFTLAHEVGHVLLDQPGHPDDFGRDLPSRLMDADAADPTAFGPRRLSLDECARAFRQSGPKSPTRVLRPLSEFTAP